MRELNVLSLSGFDEDSIFRFPASIQRLSNLRTLCLSNLRLDDISIIGELITLEILSIRNSRLEELRDEDKELKSISAGFLSRLVRLKELHMVEVRYCSYSTLRELESLSRLTTLTLDQCSRDVIYKKLGLPSKLARYSLRVGGVISFEDDYDKNIALQVSETAPLGDWIRQLLKESEAVYSTGKGSNNVLSALQVNRLHNLKYLRLCDCASVTHLLKRTHGVIKFPNLHELQLRSLKCLTHFCSDNVKGIEFPRLRKMFLAELPEFQNFWPTANNSNPLFHEKVSCPNLEELLIGIAYSMSALCSHQLPTNYFTKLEILKVEECKKLRNLMSPSVAKDLLNLRKLEIRCCESMEEVITEQEQQGDGIMTLFPMLERLDLCRLPKLRHFFPTEQTLIFPSLRDVVINDCPEMKTFVQEERCVSTSSLEIVEVKADDLNKAMFNSKVSCPNLEYLFIEGANNMSALCSHQLPTDYFTKLGLLYVRRCPKLRNLMSQSVARGLLNLYLLEINDCESLEEVITEEEEQQGEGIITLFPILTELKLKRLPKLGHFFLTQHVLKTSVNKAMCNSKVSCPDLLTLIIRGASNMSVLFSHQLPTDYFRELVTLKVSGYEKLRNLMSPSVARGFLNLRNLKIDGCESMEEVITEEEQQGEGIITLFPMLKKLILKELPKLRHFFLTEHTLGFPSLMEVRIRNCPKMKTFVQDGRCVSTPSLQSVNNDDDLNKAMFDSKVSCPDLKRLVIYGANSMSAICSHQLPTDHFTKLETLEVSTCGKLRNLISPSVAEGLLNLRILKIDDCESMEEVITEEQQQGEGIMTLLEKLDLCWLPNLRHFFLTEHALEFPLLKQVRIFVCPKMKSFVQLGIYVSTPSLQSVKYGYNEVKVDDLNKFIQQRFNYQEQQASQSATHGDKSEANDGDDSKE